MTSAETRARVTLARDTIHNPDEPRHFMRVKPVKARVRALFGGRVLAESDRALRVLEAGRDLYDPVLYFPAGDVRAKLSPVEKRTFCPLKGHASCFDLASDEGGAEAPEIAWIYRETFEFAAEIEDLVAFDGARVAFEEHPAAAPEDS